MLMDHAMLHDECNSLATSDMFAVKLKLNLVDLLSTHYTNKYCYQIHNKSSLSLSVQQHYHGPSKVR